MLNFKDRLGFRLSFYITLAVLLVGTLVASVFLYGYWRHDRDSLSRYGLKVAEELALPARGWLVGEDAFALHEAIEARLKSESDFEYPPEYIEVLDAGGMPVASVYGVIREEAKTLKEGRREAAAKAAAPFVGVLELPGGDFFDSAYPVAVDGGRVGTIRVGTSDKGLRADIRRSAWTAAGVLFCAAILGALLGGRIASWVAAPINALVRGAEELSGGNLDYRVTASSPRELQALSGSFNQMAGNLKEKVDSLTTAKREAEELSRKLSASYRESKHTAERLQETNEFVTDLAFRIEETNKSLEAEKNQTETIINSIGDGLVALDREGRVILINPEAEEMLGVKKEEVRGRPFCEAARALMEKAEGGGGLLESFTAPAPSASSGTDSCTLTLVKPYRKVLRRVSSDIKNEDGEPLGRIFLFRDVTKEKEVDEMKTNFVSTVSHELRTPLTAIKGALNLLLDDSLEDPEARREFLKIADHNTDRLVNLITNLLDLSRMEEGRVSVRCEPVDVNSVARGALGSIEILATQNGVELAAELSPGTLRVPGDREKLEQLLVNLLGNAIKFSGQGGRVSIITRVEDAAARIEVEDEGEGIPKDKLEKVFDRFYQVDMSATRKRGGTGLGLTISRAIVGEHGGRIWAESPVSPGGRGARFVVTLPLSLS